MGEPRDVRSVLLGAYAAKSCPRVVHNEYDETVPRQPAVEKPREIVDRLERGIAFEAAVFSRWLSLDRGVVDLRARDAEKSAHIEATVAAMRAGAAVILGGRLPDDLAGGRTGKPDILVREGEPGDGRVGYHPADVKAHHVLGRKQPDRNQLDPDRPDGTRPGAAVSELAAPARARAVESAERGDRPREEDLIQLAHYWRMLQACGFAAAAPWGAICGDDDPDDPRLVWFDLAAPVFETFSRTHGRAVRSALERYDHEHGFRVDVARTALRRHGRPDDPDPLVVPIGQTECQQCRWAPVCTDLLPADDASRHVGDKLRAREFLALRDRGVRTLDDLAEVDVDALLADGGTVDTARLAGRRRQLYRAIVAAQLVRDGAVLRLKADAVIGIPVADIEVDLDIEWSRDGYVYLWGALITDADGSRYVSFFDVAVGDPEGEARLARRCLDWLDGVAQAAAAEGRSLLVFHYWIPEPTKAREYLPRPVGPSHPDAWVDLLPHVRAAIDSRYGHGLKVIAQNGAGHRWRDSDPGGLQSQDWHAQALHGPPQERRRAADRLLAYNEDDVWATLRVRRWLRDEAAGQSK